MKGRWNVTLYGRVTGNSYAYWVYLPHDADPKEIINQAAGQHAETMCFFPKDIKDGEFTRQDKFALEWKEGKK